MSTRRAKIICTIGPASRTPETLKTLVEAGMDVARLNMSHGTHEEHAEVVRALREVSRATGKEVAILLDLSGPKIRLGILPEPVQLDRDDEVHFIVGEKCPDSFEVAYAIPVNYEHFASELKTGDRFSMADGTIHLETLESDGECVVKAKVLYGGLISSHKGVNLPTGGEGLASLTEKDAEDLRFGLAEGVDWVSLSFVRSAEDVEKPLAIMNELGKRVPIMAKIEKQQALENLDAILEAFDGLMVARGDLGVETSLEELPLVQKTIIRKANEAFKPVVTATQMLLSMVKNSRPTRAEVTDVANAVVDGADAVMLSEETAMGAHPALTVTTMASIAKNAAKIKAHHLERRSHTDMQMPEAIARAGKAVADELDASVIITPTEGGTTAKLVAGLRPKAPVLALSTNITAIRQLGIVWGVKAKLIEHAETTDELFAICKREALEMGLAQKGGKIVLTAGVPLEVAGTTNLLKVLEV